MIIFTSSKDWWIPSLPGVSLAYPGGTMIPTELHSLGQAARIEGFYQNFLSSDSAVENKDDIESEHGFV